jgi:hypothetical protein
MDLCYLANILNVGALFVIELSSASKLFHASTFSGVSDEGLSQSPNQQLLQSLPWFTSFLVIWTKTSSQ